jgi:hypothetical protein
VVVRRLQQNQPELEDAMFGAVTVPLDVETIDPTLVAKLMNSWDLAPGVRRQIPGGTVVFQAAFLNTTAGEPSLYRFILQFGARQAAGVVGTWLYSQLYGAAAAIQIAGRAIPVTHHDIIATLRLAG